MAGHLETAVNSSVRISSSIQGSTPVCLRLALIIYIYNYVYILLLFFFLYNFCENTQTAGFHLLIDGSHFTEAVLWVQHCGLIL